jgi:hypothetical protein
MIHLCLVFSAQLARLRFAGFEAIALARAYAINGARCFLEGGEAIASAFCQDCRVRSDLAAFAGADVATSAALRSRPEGAPNALAGAAVEKGASENNDSNFG